MQSKLSLLISVVAVLVLANAAAAAADPSLAAWWRYDEISGTAAADSSGNGNDGAVLGNPTWTAGQVRGAIHLDGTGDYIEVPPSPTLNTIGGVITATAWVLLEDTSTVHIALAKCYNNSTHTSPYFSYGLHVLANGTPRFWLSTANNNQAFAQGAAQLVKSNQWYHMAGVYDGSQLRLYLNGAVVATANASGNIKEFTTVLRMGTNGGLTEPWVGSLDDIRVYKRVLSVDEVLAVMAGAGSATEMADAPSPMVDAADVPFDATLSWTPGEFAAAHDVYLGKTLAEVADANRTNPMGVLVSQGQTETQYDPMGLEYGQTYYWRIDEVNAAPDNKVFAGEVWSFTAEPYAYPLKNVFVTASSAQPNTGPQNVVNGSGLNAMDQHGTESETMWMTMGAPPAWIQFEFDAICKLHEMWVWNSNQAIEAALGFGARNVTIEYSTDGAAWATLEDVPEFAKATGMKTYTADTAVPFGGVSAKYVKLTIQSNWSTGALPTGLSEVRFFSIPVQAREPQPTVAKTDVSVETELSWRPGREATSHEVYLSADSNAVAGGTAPVQAVTGHRCTPGSLDFATTYYWKVDEVGDAGTVPGELWSFTTQQFAVVEDFESYNYDDNRIYDTWIDGYATKASGSTVGYLDSPFVEKTIVHGGAQSMPLFFDNSASPYYSEAERTFDTAQDWTAHGADTLTVHFQGKPGAFVQLPSGNILMGSAGGDIWGTADEFRFACKQLSGNGSIVARVESIANTHAWAKAGVMIRASLDPGSTHAMLVVSPTSGLGFQRRPATGAASEHTPVSGAAPRWVKVTRTGNTFTAQHSADGVAWVDVAVTPAVQISMPASVYIGLAACSHAPNVLTSAEFSNVAITGSVTGQWQTETIGPAQPEGNAPGELYVTLKDTAGRAGTVIHPAGDTATMRAAWNVWRLPLSEFNSAGVKMSAIETITIGVGNRTNPAAGGAGLVFIDDITFGRSATK